MTDYVNNNNLRKE